MFGNPALRHLSSLIRLETPLQNVPHDLIQECVHAAMTFNEDPTVFSPLHVSQLKKGQLVTFWYLFPKEHGPFRFGVVDTVTETLCGVWTLNLLGKNGFGACFPLYRSYKLVGMTLLRVAGQDFMTRGLELFGTIADHRYGSH